MTTTKPITATTTTVTTTFGGPSTTTTVSPSSASCSLYLSPLSFNFSSLNLSEEWRKWRKKFENFELSTNFDKEISKRRVAMILHSLGDQGLDIYSSFNLEEAEEYNI